VNTIMNLRVPENVGNSREAEQLEFSQEGFGSAESSFLSFFRQILG
jgi:hypothetical protein